MTDGTPAACRACGAVDLRLILDLGDMPLAGGFLRSPAEIPAERRHPLTVHTCGACGLVQIVEPIDPDLLFADYAFASSTVAPLKQHFAGYASWLVERFQPRRVVEFGCNDGILLRPLGELGVETVGVDISENVTDIGRQEGLDIVTGYFDVPTAHELLDRAGPADIVTGSNAFAHNADPMEILRAAAVILGPDGRLCLEVMYAGDLLAQMQWDTLYHEHLTFYSLTTLSTLLARAGFSVVHAERVPMHGGSLRVVAEQRSAGELSPAGRDIERYERETALHDPATWVGFGVHVARKIDVVRSTLGRLAQSASIWGYGAAGKATMWVNACHLDYLGAMVDASPLRAGRLMPGTHTPIVFPDAFREARPDYVFITAWNYANVICSNESWYAGMWVTPLPEMRFF